MHAPSFVPFRRARRLLPALTALVLAACATGTAPAPAPTQAAATTESPAPTPLAGADPRVLGSPAAPVTIIEFTDLQCPYCARFSLETWPALRARYVDTGKVRFASRDLPLPFHAHSVPAAVAARCAGEQGKFFEYREALFRGQAHLAEAPYAAIASRFGLDTERFEACRKNPAVAQSVREDAALAKANGIASTPSFVIGREVEGQFVGEIVSGAQPLATLVERIEAVLAQ
jgi:protein-disulfide isomerase